MAAYVEVSARLLGINPTRDTDSQRLDLPLGRQVTI